MKGFFWPLLLVFVIRTFLVAPFTIPSGSMKPNLLIGDYILVNKFSYGFSKFSLPFHAPFWNGRIFSTLPHHGDTVVFVPPLRRDIYYVKRVIGLPGDTIDIIGRKIFINNQEVQNVESDPQKLSFFQDEVGQFDVFQENFPDIVESQSKDFTVIYAKESLVSNLFKSTLSPKKTYKVPEGQFFAMGDNRDFSFDSRFPEVGFIPIENLVGKVFVIGFSKQESASVLDPGSWTHFLRADRFFKKVV